MRSWQASKWASAAPKATTGSREYLQPQQGFRRSDLHFSCRWKKRCDERNTEHYSGGTFTGNQIGVNAALASLKIMSSAGFYDRLLRGIAGYFFNEVNGLFKAKGFNVDSPEPGMRIRDLLRHRGEGDGLQAVRETGLGNVENLFHESYPRRESIFTPISRFLPRTAEDLPGRWKSSAMSSTK